ncbi:MAG: methyl-accepting chemotaxis protein, partial [Acetatifactor sp.]|nr:methyl-accepting chemotaxis protein [Acetatifactor sp.]
MNAQETKVPKVTPDVPAQGGTKKKSGIKLQLILQTVAPALIIAAGLTLFARSSLVDGLETQALEGLNMLANATMAGYNNMDGDYRFENETFYKGETNLTAEMEELDNYVSNSEAAVTVCFGPTRVMTTLTDASTGQRIVGTNVSDAVWETVQRGEVYTTTHITINNADYAACYVPLQNPDGTVVGIVFAGKPRAEIDEYIDMKVSHILALAVILSVLFAGMGYFLASRIANCLIRTKGALENLATGDLNTNVDPSILRRRDELGAMGDALNNLIAKLKNIVGNLLNSANELNEAGESMDQMASQCSDATDEISRAVDEISRGAVSQAEEIENASGQIVSMGNQIESIVECVGRQSTVSTTMSNAGTASMRTMHELSDSNDKTVAALNSIAQQIQLTNESVQKIGAATE